MSEVLLDFVDNLVDNSEDEAETSAWLSATNNNNETDQVEYCSIPTEVFEDFTAEEFSNTNIIEWMHSIPPRFGKTNDILNLMIGTEDQQQEYVRGLLASSIALFFFFLVWAGLLLIFKFFAPPNGSNYTRWLGGQPLRMPSPPLGDDEDGNNNNIHYNSSKGDTKEFRDWKREYNTTKYQLFGFRIIVWFAGLAIAIAALVMSVYGVDSLKNTLDAGRESIGIVRTLASDAHSIVDSVIAQNEDLSQKVYGLLEDVNGMCPLVKDPLCDNVYDIHTCDISSFLGSDLNDVFQMAAGHFVEGEQSVYFKEIVNAKNGLEDVQMISQDIDHSASQLNWALTLSMVFSLLLAGLCLLILCGLVFPDMPKVIQCLQSKLMIPIFVVLVFFAYLFSLLFVTASIVTADVCVYTNAANNIDERIMSVLTRSSAVEELLGGQDTQSLVTEFIGFYIHQCPVELLPNEILEQLEYIKAGVPVIQQFSTIVEESTGLIQGVCGFQENQTQSLVDVADTLQDQLCAVADILSDVRDFVQCSNWYPLYETTVYEAMCYDGTEGFAYVASTQFVIVFMAFVILTFRVAFWEIQVGDDYFDFVDDDSNENSGDEGTGEGDTKKAKGNGNVDYYKGLRDRVSASRSSSTTAEVTPDTMEGRMERLRQSQWQKQQQLQQNDQRGAPLDDLHLDSSLDNTAITTTVTNSFCSSFEEEHQQYQKQHDQFSRNSRYPSRRPNNLVGGSIPASSNNSGDVVRDGGGSHRDDIPSLHSQTRIVGSTSTGAVDNGEDGGIEVEHCYNESRSSRQSRTVDATSLWARQHGSDDEDDDFSKGSVDDDFGVDWSGEI